MRRFDWETPVVEVSIIGGWPGDMTRQPTISVNHPEVEDITISMESGHMANIAFVAIQWRNGSVTMIPATSAIVVLAPPKEGDDG